MVRGCFRVGKQAQMIPVLASIKVHTPRGMKLPASLVSHLQHGRNGAKKGRTGDIALVLGRVRYSNDADNARDAHAAKIPLAMEPHPDGMSGTAHNAPIKKTNMMPIFSRRGKCNLDTSLIGKAKMIASVMRLVIP